MAAAAFLPRRCSVLAVCLCVAAVASSWPSGLAAPTGDRNIGIEGLFVGRMLPPSQMVISTSDINRLTVVPPGVGRLFVLQAKDLIKYQVTLSATTIETASGSTAKGTKDFIQWPRDDMCNGAALLAVAYREDQLPAGIIPPVNLALTSPTATYRQSISYISRGCQPQPTEPKPASESEDDSYIFVDYSYDPAAASSNDTNEADSSSSQLQRQQSLDSYPNSTWTSYTVLKPQIEALVNGTKSGADFKPVMSWAANDTASFMDAAFGEGVYAARPQVAESKQRYTELMQQVGGILEQLQGDNSTSESDAAPQQAIEALQAAYSAVYEYNCNIYQAELQNRVLNISLSQKILKECAPQGARVFVFVYNCLEPDNITVPATSTTRAQQSQTNPELLVSVKLDIRGTAEQACMTAVDRFVWYLNWTTLIIAGVVAVGFTLLFEIAPTLQHKLTSRASGASRIHGSSGNVMRADVSSTGSRSREQCCGCCGVIIRAVKTMNSPSGYSRVYTIMATTTASLLVAAIVWQPSLHPAAQHDHAWFDNPIGPNKDDVTKNRAADIEFYAKVMGISALIGYAVKLALLANLGAPDPGSTGVVVSTEVWRRQVAISIIGIAVLSLLVVSNASYMLNQSRAWIYPLPYVYLVAILILHHLATVVSFIIFTFIKPPPLTSSSYHLMPSGPAELKSTVSSQSKSGDDSSAKAKGAFHWLKSLPGRLYASVSEEEHLRYSSWILTPVWLSACLMVFWYLMGVSKSDEMVDCIRSPQDCVAGRLQSWLNLGDAVLDTETMQYTMQVLQGLDQNDLQAGVSLLQTIRTNFNGSKAESDQLERVSQRLLDVSNATRRLYRPYLNTTAPKLERWQEQAEKAYFGGRLLGYTLAFVFAAISLVNILKTFKRILLHRYLNTLDPHQQARMIQQLRNVDSIQGRALARAMTLLRNRDDEGFSTTDITQWNSHAAAQPLQYGAAATAAPAQNLDFQQSAGMTEHDAAYIGPGYSPDDHNRADHVLSVSIDTVHHTGSLPQSHGQFADKDADLQPSPYPAAAYGLQHPLNSPAPHSDGSNLPGAIYPSAVVGNAQDHQWSAGVGGVDALRAEAAASAALESAASAATQLVMNVTTPSAPSRIAVSSKDPRYDHHDLHRNDESDQDLEDYQGPSGGGGVVGLESNSGTATAEIMYTIQMLESDMSVFGIGASVALFGVLVSTMWIQIRVVGFILTVAATVLFHPAFWSSVMSKYWVSIVSVIGLILFNMLVIKRVIGSQWLSDGTHIKHRGAWMTFYLMCQLAFLVVGLLYATWRVIWALIVMLLYSVACLDRSILLFFKFLDGSYIAFVTSVKLESAWKEISQQRVTTVAPGHTIPQHDDDLVGDHLATHKQDDMQTHTAQQQLQQQHVPALGV